MTTFRVMVDNLKAANPEIAEVVGVMSASVSEILASTAKLASGARRTNFRDSADSRPIGSGGRTQRGRARRRIDVSETAQKASAVSQGGIQRRRICGRVNRSMDHMSSVGRQYPAVERAGAGHRRINLHLTDLAEQITHPCGQRLIERRKRGSKEASRWWARK